VDVFHKLDDSAGPRRYALVEKAGKWDDLMERNARAGLFILQHVPGCWHLIGRFKFGDVAGSGGLWDATASCVRC
jgi:hypothetical protein